MPWPEPCFYCGHSTMHSSGVCQLCREQAERESALRLDARRREEKRARKHERNRIRKMLKRREEKALRRAERYDTQAVI
jgi:hypothetical protein